MTGKKKFGWKVCTYWPMLKFLPPKKKKKNGRPAHQAWHRLIFQPIKENKCDFNCGKLNSWAVPSYQVAHDMLHLMSTLRVAHYFHTIVPGPLQLACWRQFAVQLGNCKNLKEHLSIWLLLLLTYIIYVTHMDRKSLKSPSLCSLRLYELLWKCTVSYCKLLSWIDKLVSLRNV